MDTETIKNEISRLIYFLSLPSTDVIWSKYENANEAIEELKLLETDIINNDKNSIDKLLYLLSPTASLQEISIDSGWGNEYLDIAEKLETALGKQAV